MEEILGAVATLKDAGAADITLLHCISAYPAPAGEANLSAIAAIRDVTGCKVGWSDHTRRPAVIERAVHRWGASAVEFHLDLDGKGAEYLAGHCWLPEEIAPVIARVREAFEADGTGSKNRSPPSSPTATGAPIRTTACARCATSARSGSRPHERAQAHRCGDPGAIGLDARLDDRDDAPAFGHAAGSQTARMWRSGRMPSCGSARQSRSASSAGCGPLNPVPSAVECLAYASDDGRDFFRQPAMPGRVFGALAVEIEMEFHRAGAPAMDRAFDHGRAARVVGPADLAAGGVADGGDGGKVASPAGVG